MASQQRASNKIRRFEYVDAKSSKFWEVLVRENVVEVCFGKIGAQGRSQSKQFDDSTVAHAHTEKLVAEKLAKGYVLVSTEKPKKAVGRKPSPKQALEIDLDRVLIGHYPKVLKFDTNLEAKFQEKHGPAIKSCYGAADYEQAEAQGAVLQADLHIAGNDIVEILHFPADAVGYAYVVIEDLANLKELYIDVENTSEFPLRNALLSILGYSPDLKWLICKNLPKLEKIEIRSELVWLEIQGANALKIVDLSQSQSIEHLAIQGATNIEQINVKHCKKLRSIKKLSDQDQTRLGVTQQIEKLQTKTKGDSTIYRNMTYTDIDRTLETINAGIKHISIKKLYNEREEKYCDGRERDPNYRKFSISLLQPHEWVNAGGTGTTFAYQLNIHSFCENTSEWCTDESQGYSTPEKCLQQAVTWVEQVVTFSENSTKKELLLLKQFADAQDKKFKVRKGSTLPPPYDYSPAIQIKTSNTDALVKGTNKEGSNLSSTKTPSAELSVVVGKKPLTQADAYKKVLEYIDANSQRDGINKRIIHANLTLLPIFSRRYLIWESELHKIIKAHLC